MRINHNIPALNAYNKLATNQNAISKSLERLSSGKRINRAGDDAAGLAVAQKMETQVRGLDMASRNALDGVSVIQVAEGALNEVHSMLQRARELSLQAANGTLTNDDRLAIQDEITQLKTEINRVSNTTEFNTRKLLNGDIDKRASSDNPAFAALKYTSDQINPGNYKVNVSQAATQATYVSTTPMTASTLSGLHDGDVLYINDEKATFTASETVTSAFEKIRDLAYKVGIDAGIDSSGNISFLNRAYGSTGTPSIKVQGNALAALGLTENSVSNPAGSIYTDGTNVAAAFTSPISPDYPAAVTISTKGNEISVNAAGDWELKLTGACDKRIIQSDGTISTAASAISAADVTINVLSTGPMNLQIGANEGQVLELRIGNMDTTSLGIDDLNVLTEANSQQAVSQCDEAIRYVSRFRSKLGAYQNRLEHTINNLDTAHENMTASMSRIEDADMAKEMAEYTKNNVLIQAGTSMLAQANQLPQGVLQLLK